MRIEISHTFTQRPLSFPIDVVVVTPICTDELPVPLQAIPCPAAIRDHMTHSEALPIASVVPAVGQWRRGTAVGGEAGRQDAQHSSCQGKGHVGLQLAS